MLEKELQWYDLKEDGIGSLLVRIQTQIRELQLAISQPLGFVFTEICGASIALGSQYRKRAYDLLLLFVRDAIG
ncbi:hypothetical protein M7I_2084 [Glarea lozoyensis 74030]|uniref:Uncharacterized protein n=1 Tax=Glarea lozoyensis (strain ATCC 74030 / MF5533) TaxID=1104152 RepID=H0EHU5_GLAL7|nr:hypothetical protein M7I_2084 [Glarea lozoyensis 74030]